MWARRGFILPMLLERRHTLLRLFRRALPERGRVQSAAIPKVTGWVQCAQRFASIGISILHSGHFLVVGSAWAGALRVRATKSFTGVITQKYTAAATSRNATAALIKSPRAKTLPLMVKLMAEKSGLPTMAAINGVSRSLVNALTTVANAAPITTPTAISTTFPRRMNCLKPLSINTSSGRAGVL